MTHNNWTVEFVDSHVIGSKAVIMTNDWQEIALVNHNDDAELIVRAVHTNQEGGKER